MKQVTVAEKALSVIFAILLMAGCASTDTSEEDAAMAEKEAKEAMMAEEEARKAETMRKMKMLEDAVASAGNVVYFDFDKSTLNAATRRVLDAHIALLKSNSDTVRLEGHADERGTREYNMALGERRAKAVLDYMAVNGIGRGRVETVSYGEERPAVSGTGAAAWSKNRRVEIK